MDDALRADRHDRQSGMRRPATSQGWVQWSVDLSAYAGSQVEVSITYVSDWSTQGIRVSSSTTSR